MRQLQRFCRGLRKELNTVQPHSRYETQPGVQMQIDFAEKDAIVNGETLRVHFFIAVLGYSRRIFAKAYSAENQAAWPLTRRHNRLLTENRQSDDVWG